MLLTTLPPAVRLAAIGQRSFHTSTPKPASVLFALGALSNSRETVHFNKISRLPRTEHSPPLKLIKTGEVDAFPLPDPPPSTPPSTAWASTRPVSVGKVWDDKALQIGRVFLANQARQSRRLRHALARMKRNQTVRDVLAKKERTAWQQERAKLQNDVRAAGVWIVASIATATALAMWRFWPGAAPPKDSAELGREIAERAARAMAVPRAVTAETAVPAVESAAAMSSGVPASKEVAGAAPVAPVEPVQGSWWKGLFWKQ